MYGVPTLEIQELLLVELKMGYNVFFYQMIKNQMFQKRRRESYKMVVESKHIVMKMVIQ